MRTFSFALKAAIVIAVPLLACSTYYTLERLASAGPALYLAASVALPVLLLGLVGTVRTVGAGKTKGLQLWISGFAIAVPALLLVFIWL
jgi:hypothetical protein